MKHGIDIFKQIKKESNLRFEKPDPKFLKQIDLGRESAKIRWHSENAKKSKHDIELKFTNYLGTSIPSDIKNRLLEVKADISKLRDYEYRPVDELQRKSRYKNILSLYLDEIPIDDCYGLIYKFQCKSLVGVTASIRFYFLYEVNPDTREYFQSVFLVDPFHLVIPSSRVKRNKKYDANQVLLMDYDTNKCNKRCLSEFLMS